MLCHWCPICSFRWKCWHTVKFYRWLVCAHLHNTIINQPMWEHIQITPTTTHTQEKQYGIVQWCINFTTNLLCVYIHEYVGVIMCISGIIVNLHVPVFNSNFSVLIHGIFAKIFASLCEFFVVCITGVILNVVLSNFHQIWRVMTCCTSIYCSAIYVIMERITETDNIALAFIACTLTCLWNSSTTFIFFSFCTTQIFIGKNNSYSKGHHSMPTLIPQYDKK